MGALTGGAAGVPVRVTYTATADDLARAYQRHNHASLWRWRTLPGVAAVLVLLAVALAFAMPHDRAAAYVVFALAAAGGVIGPFLMIRWRVPVLARRIYAQQRELHEAIAVSADAEALSTRTTTGDNRTPWSHYVRWVEDDHVVMLYLSDALFQFVPKRFLAAAEIDALRTLAAAGGVQAGLRRSR